MNFPVFIFYLVESVDYVLHEKAFVFKAEIILKFFYPESA